MPRFLVAAIEADYIQSLLHDRQVRLLNFDQREAYRQRFRYLVPVTLPKGMVNLGENVPPHDVDLLARRRCSRFARISIPHWFRFLVNHGCPHPRQGGSALEPRRISVAVLLRLPRQ